MKSTLLVGLVVSALLTLTACPGTSLPSPTQPPQPPQSPQPPAPTDTLGPSQYSADQRNDAMDRVALEYERLLTANTPNPLEALATFARTQPEFDRVGVGDKTLWARFKDGRTFVYLDNFNSSVRNAPTAANLAPRQPRSSLVTSSVPERLSGLAPTAASGLLPGSNTALIVQQDIADTAGHKPYMDKLEKMLQKRGYAVNRMDTVKIEAMKNLTAPVGLFYHHGHGGEFYWGDRFDTPEYGLVTDDKVSPENEQRYAEDIQKGRLLYGRVRAERSPRAPGRYILSGRFFAVYLPMAPRAVVYINACNGGSGAAELFRQAFLARGAGLYIGYDGPTTDLGYDPAVYFFDRTLGANLAEAPTPAGRVFRVNEVWEAMARKRHAGFPNANYLTDAVNGSTLRRFGNATQLLAPNIQSLRFLLNDYLRIATDVPADDPDLKVRVGGKLVPHVVNEGRLMVQLEPNMTGDVTLEVHGLTSNARPITSWRGPVTYTAWLSPGGEETAKLTVTFDLHLRADAYGVRRAVDGPLEEDGQAFYAATDSTARYQFSGSAGPITYSGSGNLQYGFPAVEGGFAATGYVHAPQRRLRILPAFFTVQGTASVSEGSQSIDLPQAVPFEFLDTNLTPGREIVPKGWFMDIDTDLSIKARTYSGRIEGVEMNTISWPRLSAMPAYRDDVER